LKTNYPFLFWVPDGYDPDHFMPWAHPFISMIAGPTCSGKSMFVRRFVYNIKHMMTPKPDRILWCYGPSVSGGGGGVYPSVSGGGGGVYPFVSGGGGVFPSVSGS
jgi:hypothetical protein